MSEEKKLNRVLGFWDLMSASLGQIIGAGIISDSAVCHWYDHDLYRS